MAVNPCRGARLRNIPRIVPEPFLIEIAGGCPGCPAAPNGRGLPGRAVVPAGPVWSCAPGGAAWPGGCPPFLARGAPAAGCSGGSSPGSGPLAAAGHAFPSPRPVPEAAPPGHHGGGVMAADGDRSHWCCRGEPVLGAPFRCVGRVDGDHRESRVVRHLCKPVTEPGRGDAGHQGPEPRFPGRPRAGRFPRPAPGPSVLARVRSRGSRSRPRAPRAGGRCRSGRLRRPGCGHPAWTPPGRPGRGGS